MKRVCCLVLVLFFYGTARAGAPVGEDDWLRTSTQPVVALHVLRVDDQNATNANPPRLEVRIDAVLRGSLKAGSTLIARWMPDGQIAFYAQREGGQEGLRRWQQSPLNGPAAGSRWIVMGVLSGNELRVDIRPRWPDTPQARQRAAELIRRGP